MKIVLIFHIIFFSSSIYLQYSYAGEYKTILSRVNQKIIITDRNKDGVDDVVYDQYSTSYDDDYNNVFEYKVIQSISNKIILIDTNQNGTYDKKQVFNRYDQSNTKYLLKNGIWIKVREAIPIFQTTSTATNKFKINEYENNKIIKSYVYDAEVDNLFILYELLVSDANPLPKYGPNHFITMYNSCLSLNGEIIPPCDGNSYQQPIPHEMSIALNFQDQPIWCERVDTELSEFEKQYDWDRDVKTITSTGLKLTNSCPEENYSKIEQNVISAFDNLLRCFNPHNGKFPDSTRYHTIERTLSHILENGGLKVKCDVRSSRPRGVYRKAGAATYVARNEKAYENKYMSASQPYQDDNKRTITPDADFFGNIDSSSYEPSVLLLTYIPSKEDQAKKEGPGIAAIMHEILHLPTGEATFPGFRMDNHSTNVHNRLFTNDEIKEMVPGELHTKAAEKDRVYACAFLCGEGLADSVPVNKKMCLRCMSDSTTENLEDDAKAVAACEQYKD